MRKELDDKLVAKYPKIFADRHAPMTQTCMCWGFDCADGWYFLIDNLCACIQGYIDHNSHLNIPQVVAMQVKEKFGTLRFYISGGDELTRGMVWLADYMSGRICEICGKEGKVEVIHGWYECRCSEHSRLEKDKIEKDEFVP
jgi:hypothetical protein